VVDWKYDSFAKINVNTPITSYNDPDLNNVKTLINSGHILAFETDMVEWIFRYDGATQAKYKGYYVIVRHQQDLKKDWNGHVLCIVGYDDNVWFDLNKNGTKEAYECGAFKIANSRGLEWPNAADESVGGFVWVMYDALNKRSNIDAFNPLDTEMRRGIIDDYGYYYIKEVANTAPALSAKVTVKQKRRNEFSLIPAFKDDNMLLPIEGGSYNFDGTASTTEQKHTYYVAIDPLKGFGTGWEFKPWTLAVYKRGNNANNTKVEQVQFLNRYGGVFKTFAEKTLTGPNIDYVLLSGAFLMTFSDGGASASRTLATKAHKDVFKFVAKKSGIHSFFAGLGQLNHIGIYDNLTVQLLNSSQKSMGKIPAAVAVFAPGYYTLNAGQTYYLSVQNSKLKTDETQTYYISCYEPNIMVAVCY